MALEIFDAPMLGTELIGHAGIEHNGRFTYPADEEITTADLLSLVEYHRDHMRRHYVKNREYYEGDHEMLHGAPKPDYKPDNRLILNFPRKAVTTFNGFFIGNPIKIDSDKDKQVDQFVSDWAKTNDFDSVASEVSKAASIYGHAYFLVYQSEIPEGSTERAVPLIAPIEPLNAFVIYDDGYTPKPKYGVLYRRNYNHQTEITLYDDKFCRQFVENTASNEWLAQTMVTANPYLMVPLIEVDENSERLALCDDIVSLIDALDKVMSEKANDADYFADAILMIKNAHLDPAKLPEMRDNRLMNITGTTAAEAGAEYLAKPDADQSQEHLVNRLVQSIYEIANITNLNDDAFSGNPSGVSLKLKYQAMDNMARAKTLKFQAALRQVFRCVFAVSYHEVEADAWHDLDFKFTRTIPVNLLEESQFAANMYGKISQRTLLGQLSFVDDPDEELKQIKKEQQETQQAAANTMQQALAASKTDQQKAGELGNDNPQAGTSPNSPNSGAGQPNQQTAG